MPQDLRSFLDEHRDAVLRITKEVPLELVGALVGRSSSTILFDNLKGYGDWRLLDNLFKDRAMQARVVGCEPSEVVPRLAKVLDDGPGEIREVDDGPAKEHKFVGDEVDFSSLPVPMHTAEDLGPYTTSFNILRDPETGLYNSMFPRTLVKSERLGVCSYVTRHSQIILEKYKQMGKPAPQAVVIGVHPTYELACAYSGLHDYWELALAGRMLGEPIEVVKAETIDLLVPAHSEIVIEGWVYPDRLSEDGPNPGPCLYFTPWQMLQPEFEITAITMRSNPTYRHHQVTPFTDHQSLPRMFHEAQLYRWLKASGLEVREVFFPPWGGAISCIIQVNPKFDGQVEDALLSVMGAPWLNTKLVLALDPDVDIFDPADVYWALATRADPARDVIIVPNTRGNPMDPSSTPVTEAGPQAAQNRFPAVVGKMAINATKPVPYRASRKSFDRAWPAEWFKARLEDYL
jgi:2,5-furandicarboxylate decarboxylase 1